MKQVRIDESPYYSYSVVQKKYIEDMNKQDRQELVKVAKTLLNGNSKKRKREDVDLGLKHHFFESK